MGGKGGKISEKLVYLGMPRKIEISYRTIVFIAVFSLGLWFLIQIRSILLALFISLIAAFTLNPSIKKLEKLKMPRWLAILIIYITVLGVVVIAVSGVIPPLVDQTTKLINSIPGFFSQFKVLGIDEKVIASQFSQFASIPSNVIKFLFGVFSNIVAILGIAVITFYLLLERPNFGRYLTYLFGLETGKELEEIIDEIEVRLGGWIRGELLLMTFVGLLSYLGLRIIGVSFALPLAILAFCLEIVPNVGPTVAAFPAILIGLTVSPVQALAVAGLAFLVQQIENSLLVPKIMKSTAGVNPLISILSMAVGFKLAGVGGAILAIPTYIIISVILHKISTSKRFKEV